MHVALRNAFLIGLFGFGLKLHMQTIYKLDLLDLEYLETLTPIAPDKTNTHRRFIST